MFSFADTWLAGKVIALHCRSCNAVFQPGTSPASRVAPGYMSTTPCNTHSYITTAALSTAINHDMRASVHPSDAAMCSTLGYGKFLDLDCISVPLKPLRDSLRLYRTFYSFPIAVLMGFVFRCFVCGNECCRLTGDACLKAFRYALGSSNVVFGLPNYVLAPAQTTEKAVEALRIPHDSSEKLSSGCSGDRGTTRFKAAEGRSARKPICQHGIYACTCEHGCCEIAFEMFEPESITRHALLALLFALAKGCKFALNDIMCILLAHIASRGHRDLRTTLLALVAAGSTSTGVSVDDVSKTIPHVSLQLRDGVHRLAEFVLSCNTDGTSPLNPSPGALPGGVPVVPSDYDLAQLVWRLVARARDPEQLSVIGAIPTFHAFLHACSQSLGA